MLRAKIKISGEKPNIDCHTTKVELLSQQSHLGSNQSFRKETAKIHVSVEIANLLKIYCVLNNKKMVEYVTEVFSRELKEFKDRLEVMKRID